MGAECWVDGESYGGAKRWKEGWKERSGSGSGFYITWWWTEGKEKVERGRNIKGERRGAYCFCGKLMRSIWTMWLLQHTPWVTSATPKGNWNCNASPLPFLTFFFSNKRRCMSSILPREWTNKTTACSYVYRSPSFLLKIYSRNKHPLWEVGMQLASQVIFSGVAALLCSLIRFPFLSGVISLSGAPTNLAATVHLKEKNSVTSTPTHHRYRRRKQQHCIIMLSL